MNPETVARARAAVRRLVFRGHVPTGALPGARTSSLPGPGSSFGGYREYQYGDDLRLLDWNVFARSGRPHVKVFQQDRAAAFVFVLDISRSMVAPDADKWEAAAEDVCTLAGVAGQDDESIGYVAVSDRIESKERPRRGARHASLFVDAIAGLAPHGRGTALTQALHSASRFLRRPGVLIVVSDCLSSGEAVPRWIEDLRAMRQHRVIALVVASPRESTLPDLGVAPLEDVETGAREWVDSSAEHVRQAFARRAIVRRRQVLQALSRVGCVPVELWTDRPVVPQLSPLLRPRGVQ